MRSEVMPTVMAQLELLESGCHFGGMFKTKDVRALVDKIAKLEALNLSNDLGVDTAVDAYVRVAAERDTLKKRIKEFGQSV